MPRIKQTAKITPFGRSKIQKVMSSKKQSAKAPVEIKTTKRRWRSGTVAKREIKKLSRSTHPLIHKSPFRRLVREIAQEFKADTKFSLQAMQALQEGVEDFLPELFTKADIAREHRGCETMMKKDLVLASYLSYKCMDMRRRRVRDFVCASNTEGDL